jgi:mannan endo-1,4-beta-mannosidase
MNCPTTVAINAFNQRITHILNIHKNSLLGNQPWSELGAYIFGWEPQNE